MSIPLRRDYYDILNVNLQMREGVTMAKMYQVDKMAIMATMAKMAFQLVQLWTHEYKVNQFESIKMGMSRKIVLKKRGKSAAYQLDCLARQMCRDFRAKENPLQVACKGWGTGNQ